jgi:hypothetical protein
MSGWNWTASAMRRPIPQSAPGASTSPARSISTAPMARPRAAPTSMCWIIAGPTICRRRCSG